MKKIFQKIITVCLSLIAVFSFAACEGKSAYEVAVDNGFSGTEAEWLASLKGFNGKDGDDLDIEDIYEKSGYTGTFNEFLYEYFGADSLEIVEDNNTAQIAHNMMSVVSVQAFSTGSAGSGVIIDIDKESGNAIIVTNYHVVYSAERNVSWKENIYVYLYGAKMYSTNSAYQITSYGDGMPVTYLGGSMNYDIAVLQVSGNEYLKTSAAEVAKIGNSDKASVGEKLYAIGNPKGYGIALTEGVLSVDSEYITLTMEVPGKTTGGIFGGGYATIEEVEVRYRVLRTDAAINSGNSGGALFNVQGELIGIVNAKSASTGTDNMGYALPITQVDYVVKNILHESNGTGSVKRAMLGITVTTDSSKAEIDKAGRLHILEQVSVYEVEDSAAAKGILQSGDVIKSIAIGNGEAKAVTRQFMVVDYMLNVRKGDTVKLVVERNGEEKTLTVTYDMDKYFTAY
jgi:serine protease Do